MLFEPIDDRESEENEVTKHLAVNGMKYTLNQSEYDFFKKILPTCGDEETALSFLEKLSISVTQLELSEKVKLLNIKEHISNPWTLIEEHTVTEKEINNALEEIKAPRVVILPPGYQLSIDASGTINQFNVPEGGYLELNLFRPNQVQTTHEDKEIEEQLVKKPHHQKL